MEILNNRESLKGYINAQKEQGKSIGFAPTMGALHSGHLSLYEHARKDNDIVISSIFVNPTQFNNPEDLEKYPRTIDKDINLLKEHGFVDAVYIPTINDIYPNGAQSKQYDFGGLESEMEGKFRPGHFDGVGTVVEELLRQVQPNRAYFGEKDFQQLAIIKKLIEITGLPVEIYGIPIVREENGLALSSRNQRLSPERRAEAKLIYETLTKANEDFKAGKNPSEIRRAVAQTFDNIKDYTLEYISIADEETLREAHEFLPSKSYRAFIVVVVDGVRLIDNLHLK
ncbi:pantoate--beta-alanine ligase [Bergeyella cardium]|uniref:Pantothenate synthetase n=1 Tax=Bergeyella cardium TaxID=1585976 RepID=A0A6P1QSD2_9FLAO|nr:pantoate--beta-alanine ligase [Bergeyella cardium]QHN64575.1 pantoate--beta-alanine ligase [Bergeyella cardium]WHE33868.1 pantoate--beta-alanine ligase [Bergeyella cardium]WHF60518.1 pantoate--beta-alanine ligase [Bergeyella cardium]